MSKKRIKQIVSLVAVLFAAFGYLFQDHLLEPVVLAEDQVVATSTKPVVIEVSTATNALVTHVADGDTIEALVDGQKDPIKIRLLGVNTPETVDPRRPVECFGKEASNFTKSTLSDQRIRLEEDPQADNIDKYGRFLRIVIQADGQNFNDRLVQEGYAYAYVSFPSSAAFKAKIRRLELEAKTAQRGLWNPNACAGVK